MAEKAKKISLGRLEVVKKTAPIVADVTALALETKNLGRHQRRTLGDGTLVEIDRALQSVEGTKRDLAKIILQTMNGDEDIVVATLESGTLTNGLLAEVRTQGKRGNLPVTARSAATGEVENGKKKDLIVVKRR